MSRYAIRRVATASIAGAAILCGALGVPQLVSTPSPNRWRPGDVYSLEMKRSVARAAPTTCDAGIKRMTLRYVKTNRQYQCLDDQVDPSAIETAIEYCGGATSPTPSTTPECNGYCFLQNPCGDGPQWAANFQQGACADHACYNDFPPASGSPIPTIVLCEGACSTPAPKPCSGAQGGNCGCDNGGNCVGQPISVPGAELTYRLPLFPLTDPAGEFELTWNGRSSPYGSVTTDALSSSSGPFGPRLSHSFDYFLWKGSNADGTHHAVARVAGGAEESFLWDVNTSSWLSETGDTSVLTAGAPGVTCPSTATLTMPDGRVISFNEYCDGLPGEGEPTLISFPDANYVTFSLVSSGSNAGKISSVTSRLGTTISFSYYDLNVDHESPGFVKSVTAPDGNTYSFNYGGPLGELSNVTGPGGFGYSLELDPTTGALTGVTDANSNVIATWTYDSTGTVPATEQIAGENSIALTMPTPGTVRLSFTAPDGSNVQNDYVYESPSGANARVVSRTVNGACPNCGVGNETRVFDPVHVNAVRCSTDANGWITFNSDFDSDDNAQTVSTGCTGTCTATQDPTCSASSRTVYRTFVAGTHVLASEERPSANAGASPTPVDSKEFVSGTTRVYRDHRQGYTAGSLSGALDTLKTRTTQYTYGGSVGGVDVTVVDGPYDGSGAPPGDNSEPLTSYAYYPTSGTITTDYCDNTSDSLDTGRLKSIIRSVSSTRTLVRYFCEYDGNARPTKIMNEDGSITLISYDARGSISLVTEDFGSAPHLNLNTQYYYDAAENLIEIHLPLIAGSHYSGIKYTYNSANQLTAVYHGYYAGPAKGTGFTALERMEYGYADGWGNITSKQAGEGSLGPIDTSEDDAYDAFGRLASVKRPSASAFVTTFGYDALGHLTTVTNAQGDPLQYGDQNDITKYDQFGHITRVRQKICSHLPGDPGGVNGTCQNPLTADIDYTYDPALQLSQVKVQRTDGSTLTQTDYVTDDFGGVVAVVSPDSGTTKYSYDPQGRLFQAQDARGKKFQFNYDRLGRVTSKVNLGTSATEVTWCYDGYDSACGYTDSARAGGRLTAVKDKIGRVKYTYDTAGRMTQESRTFTVYGEPLYNSTQATAYAWNANGVLTGVTGPNGLKISYFRDEAGHETQVQWAYGIDSYAVIARSIVYYPFGGLRSWYRNATSSWKFERVEDSGGRITSVDVTGKAGSDAITYDYANDGNVMKIPSTLPTPNILHDSLGRIIQDRGLSGGTFTHGYDEAGNRNAGSGNPFTYTAGTDKLTATNVLGAYSYSFDAAGNVSAKTNVSAITVADDGTVTGVTTGSGSTTWGRDYRGLRMERYGASGSATYFYDQGGEMISWTGPTSLGAICKSGFPPIFKQIVPYENYVIVGGLRIAIVKSHATITPTSCTGAGTVLTVDDVQFLQNDKMGMPHYAYSDARGVTIWTGDFDAFGENIATQNQDPDGDGVTTDIRFRLPGQFALTTAEGGPDKTLGLTGLVENWNRVYDTAIGRYLEGDPARDDRPQATTRYSYASSEPLRRFDPMGLASVDTSGIGNCEFSECMPKDQYGPTQLFWDQGYATAKNAAAKGTCQGAFKKLWPSANIEQLLQDNGSPPQIIVGAPGNCVYGWCPYGSGGNTLAYQPKITCPTLRGSARIVAQTLMHEMAHWVALQGGTHYSGPELPDYKGEGYDIEKACFGTIAEQPGIFCPSCDAK